MGPCPTKGEPASEPVFQDSSVGWPVWPSNRPTLWWSVFLRFLSRDIDFFRNATLGRGRTHNLAQVLRVPLFVRTPAAQLRQKWSRGRIQDLWSQNRITFVRTPAALYISAYLPDSSQPTDEDESTVQAIMGIIRSISPVSRAFPSQGHPGRRSRHNPTGASRLDHRRSSARIPTTQESTAGAVDSQAWVQLCFSVGLETWTTGLQTLANLGHATDNRTARWGRALNRTISWAVQATVSDEDAERQPLDQIMRCFVQGMRRDVSHVVLPSTRRTLCIARREGPRETFAERHSANGADDRSGASANERQVVRPRHVPMSMRDNSGHASIDTAKCSQVLYEHCTRTARRPSLHISMRRRHPTGTIRQ